MQKVPLKEGQHHGSFLKLASDPILYRIYRILEHCIVFNPPGSPLIEKKVLGFAASNPNLIGERARSIIFRTLWLLIGAAVVEGVGARQRSPK
jgi:hypothetical protein